MLPQPRADAMRPVDRALVVASKGWRVFPCNGKAALVPWKRNASSDPRAVRQMWRRHPRANVGIALPEGTIVVDVDDLAAFKATGLVLPDAPGQGTPSGGFHRLFSTNGHSASQTVKATPGIDTRVGGKGYIVAWDPDGLPNTGALPLAPDWVYGERRSRKVAVAFEDPGGAIPATQRNSTLTSLGGSMRDRGMTEEAIYAALKVENDTRCVPPLPDADVRTIAHSVAKYAPGNVPSAIGTTPTEDRTIDGAAFILDIPEHLDPLWGMGNTVAWAKGESLILTGPQGTGKSTLAQQALLHRIGVREGPFLGMEVERDDRPVLYVAADRPPQIQRSFARMVTERDRELLSKRLLVWRGPLPFALDASPAAALADFCQERGVSAAVIDSLKDVVGKVSDDESGLRINQALQEALARGIDLVLIHHQRKASGENKRPMTLDDVHGSAHITRGAGSVLLVWGKPGDTHVELHHLKQPMDDVGPLNLVHDHGAGTTTLAGVGELKVLFQRGITARSYAQQLFGEDKPDRNAIERARRKLEAMPGIERKPGVSGTGGGKPETVYVLPKDEPS